MFEFNKAMESHFKDNPNFRNVHVKGEVSNTFISSRGHLYFTLKDKRSQVPCIVYEWFRKDIAFDVEDGMKLLVIANVSVYPPHGKYQLDVRSAIEDGLGQLFVKYQQLRKKLDGEGLFDSKHKKDIPHFVKRIGVITSEGGAVIHDIIKTVRQNWPYCQVFLFPAAVQGANSKNELVRQIKRADEFNMDVLIVGRGGGSIEDLWSFNEEIVARTIFDCKTPVISAIGHEDDTTLSDLVADKRASTPTMAASLAIEDKDAISEKVNHLNNRLNSVISSKLDDYRKQLMLMFAKPVFSDSAYIYSNQKSEFEDLYDRFNMTSNELVKSHRVALEKMTNEYVIRHPCKMQLDSSKSSLNELRVRLLDAMNLIINNQKVNLDKASDKFNFLSEKLVTSKRHGLEMSKSALITNPYQNQLDSSRKDLNIIEGKLINNVNVNVRNSKRDLEILENSFENRSRELIMKKSHELDSIKSKGIIKNPQRLFESKYNELEQMKNNKMIKNPNLILDSYKSELDIYREKLDKIKQVLELKKEQQMQKQRYMIVIAAIVIVMIIVLVILGGIL